MTHTDTATRRRRLIADLREFATYLEAHAHIPIPRYLDLEFQVHTRNDTDAATEDEAIAEVGRIAERLGVPVTVRSGHHVATLRMGLVVYKAVAIEEQARAAYRSSLRPDDSGGVR
ncbi:hypothetical protein ACIBKY_12195 [Nonomuraea sp. NPDC050394]|uniref:hypothetical protein n=1 Tax=Nonomuraea sp. NPDC050394 TaxID=3364363 RepID=UPI00378F8FCA